MIVGIWTDGGWLSGLLVAVGAVFLIVLVMRLLGAGAKRQVRTTREARVLARGLQLLDDSYTRGELTTEEYRGQVRVLSNEGGRSPLGGGTR